MGLRPRHRHDQRGGDTLTETWIRTEAGMGILDKVLVGGMVALLGAGVRLIYQDAAETKRRKNSPLQFDNRLTEQDFISMVERIAAKTPRSEKVEVTGMVVRLTVRSNSGLTSWTTEVDFNDYGRLTGRYWLTSENDQSPIPKVFADTVKDEILTRVG